MRLTRILIVLVALASGCSSPGSLRTCGFVSDGRRMVTAADVYSAENAAEIRRINDHSDLSSSLSWDLIARVERLSLPQAR